jgi:transcription-repair coupling factor (superfamily II helicase)
MGFSTELIARLSNSFLAKQMFKDLASGSVVATGCADSFARLVCASAYSHLQRPFLYLTPDEESSFNAASDLGALLERDIPVLPALPPLYQGISPHPDVVAEHALALLTASGAGLLVASVESVIRMLPPHEWFCGMHLDLSMGQEQSPDVLLRKLVAMGYRRGTRVETPGEVAVRGGILDFFPNGAEMPTRLEFDGDTIAAMRLFDPITQLSRKTADKVELVPTSAFLLLLTPVNASQR